MVWKARKENNMVLHFDPQESADRFIRYASVFTQSKEGVPDTPSTTCQFDLARLLAKELEEMGASCVYLDEEKCYVYAQIPGNIPVDSRKLNERSDARTKRRENLAPIIGLIAHMDTTDAVDASAQRKIHPRKITNYDGKEIVLNDSCRMNPDQFPDLAVQKGNTLIVADGTSVLGGDDKAGVTQIMEVADFLLHHPEIAHGTIRIMFTPDEEVGNGTLHANLNRFAVDYAYTIDGGGMGGIEYECFNAAEAHVTIQGLSVHPGDAKGRMRNALLVAMELNGLLPQDEIPSRTQGYEGFYHLCEMNGTTENASLVYLIRDHDKNHFEQRKAVLQAAASTINDRYGENTAKIQIEDSYYNMEEKIRPHMHLVENAREAMKEVGIQPIISPIRGGTDGALLSFRGIPCPNLATGAYRIHSRYEYVVAQEMSMSAEVLLRILNRYAGYELDEER